MRLSMIKDTTTNSVCVIYLELWLKRAGLWILGRPTFNQLPEFDYPPLNFKGEIRLLRVGTQIPFFDLQAELIAYPLDDPPPYEAISYVWGKDPRMTHKIILDNQKFYVTANVYNILRRRSSFFRSRLIWIDSICISQDDKKEKSKQVRTMKKIYETASRVFVCLGETPQAYLAVSLLNELIVMKSFLGPQALAQHIFEFHWKRDSDKMLGARFHALLDLLHHPWFDRVWVIQEPVAGRSVNVLCGSHQIVWDYLMILTDILTSPQTAEVISLFQYSGKQFVNRPLPLGPTQGAFMTGFRDMFRMGQDFPLHDAFKATEPRDKVFALLELTTSASDLAHVVDYEKPIPDVLMEVSSHILDKGDLLEVLHLAGISWKRDHLNLHSWVIEWTMSREPATLAHSIHKSHLQYRAGICEKPLISLDINKRHIIIRGQIIDSITHLGSDLQTPANFNSLVRAADGIKPMIAWLAEARRLAANYAAPFYPTGQPLSEATWRTFIGDRTMTTRPAPSFYGDRIEK